MPNFLTPPPGFGISTLRTGCGLYVPRSNCARMAGQCSRRSSSVSSIVLPSTPGLPLLPWTCFQAFTRLFRSHTSSISRSSRAGLSVSRFTADGSVPCWTRLGASPFDTSTKASRCWIFCRCPSMSCGPYLPLSSVRAFDHRSRLGLSVRSVFRLVECLTSFADCMTYFAFC